MKPPILEVPKALLTLMNHLYEIETKLQRSGDGANAIRNVEKMKEALENLEFPIQGAGLREKGGFFYEDPFGQEFKETRTDLDATIAGESTENLQVVEVIKPIVRFGTQEYSRVVQRGIVVVGAKNPSGGQHG